MYSRRTDLDHALKQAIRDIGSTRLMRLALSFYFGLVLLWAFPLLFLFAFGGLTGAAATNSWLIDAMSHFVVSGALPVLLSLPLLAFAPASRRVSVSNRGAVMRRVELLGTRYMLNPVEGTGADGLPRCSFSRSIGFLSINCETSFPEEGDVEIRGVFCLVYLLGNALERYEGGESISLLPSAARRR